MRTVGQQEFIEGVKKFIEDDFPRKEYIALQGDPGTGKTFVIADLDNEFPDLNILYVAYTGKAVDNLNKKGLNAKTIHSTFYKLVQGSSELNFELKSREEIGDWDLICFDEFSQVSQEMINELFTLKYKFIFVGDFQQIGVVSGTDNKYLMHADFILDEILRQKADSDVLKLSRWYRKYKKLPKYGAYGDVLVVDKEKITESIILKADQTICGTNQTKDIWNKRIRRVKKRIDYLPEPGERVISVKNTNVICEGRPIINGTTGTVIKTKSTTNGYFIMQFKPDWAEHPVVVKVDEKYFLGKPQNKMSDYCCFEWGYVITVNKAMGSEWDNVLFIVDQNMPKDALVKNINTGITRASKKLVLAY